MSIENDLNQIFAKDAANTATQDQQKAATKQVAQVLWNYYASLKDAGFSKIEAFQLTLGMQALMWQQNNGKK